MRIHVLVGVLGIAAVGSSGCAHEPMVQVSGHEVTQSSWDAVVDRVTPVAAFELRCPAGLLQLTVLNVTTYDWAPEPTQVGASGCGRQLVYVPRGMNWVSTPGAGSAGQ